MDWQNNRHMNEQTTDKQTDNTWLTMYDFNCEAATKYLRHNLMVIIAQ